MMVAISIEHVILYHISEHINYMHQNAVVMLKFKF